MCRKVLSKPYFANVCISPLVDEVLQCEMLKLHCKWLEKEHEKQSRRRRRARSRTLWWKRKAEKATSSCEKWKKRHAIIQQDLLEARASFVEDIQKAISTLREASTNHEAHVALSMARTSAISMTSTNTSARERRMSQDSDDSLITTRRRKPFQRSISTSDAERRQTHTLDHEITSSSRSIADTAIPSDIFAYSPITDSN